MTIEFHQLSAPIGARVTGVDPTSPLTDETAATLRRAVATHKALALDAPGLDTDGQERFAHALGDSISSSEVPTTVAAPREAGLATAGAR